jgi:hypothetical protein
VEDFFLVAKIVNVPEPAPRARQNKQSESFALYLSRHKLRLDLCDKKNLYVKLWAQKRKSAESNAADVARHSDAVFRC